MKMVDMSEWSKETALSWGMQREKELEASKQCNDLRIARIHAAAMVMSAYYTTTCPPDGGTPDLVRQAREFLGKEFQ